MADLLYAEGWLLVALSLAAAFACWRNARRIHNSQGVIRWAKVIICLSIAAELTLGLTRTIPPILALALLLASMCAQILSLLAREIVEAPFVAHDRN